MEGRKIDDNDGDIKSDRWDRLAVLLNKEQWSEEERLWLLWYLEHTDNLELFSMCFLEFKVALELGPTSEVFTQQNQQAVFENIQQAIDKQRL